MLHLDLSKQQEPACAASGRVFTKRARAASGLVWKHGICAVPGGACLHVLSILMAPELHLDMIGQQEPVLL